MFPPAFQNFGFSRLWREGGRFLHLSAIFCTLGRLLAGVCEREMGMRGGGWKCTSKAIKRSGKRMQIIDRSVRES